MSKIFYDHLIILPVLEAEIKSIAETEEEKQELWQIVDEIIHHRILELLLDTLDREHHDEFLERFHEAPHDEIHIHYLDKKVDENISELIEEKIGKMEREIINEIKSG